VSAAAYRCFQERAPRDALLLVNQRLLVIMQNKQGLRILHSKGFPAGLCLQPACYKRSGPRADGAHGFPHLSFHVLAVGNGVISQ